MKKKVGMNKKRTMKKVDLDVTAVQDGSESGHTRRK